MSYSHNPVSIVKDFCFVMCAVQTEENFLQKHQTVTTAQNVKETVPLVPQRANLQKRRRLLFLVLHHLLLHLRFLHSRCLTCMHQSLPAWSRVQLLMPVTSLTMEVTSHLHQSVVSLNSCKQLLSLHVSRLHSRLEQRIVRSYLYC